MVVKQSLEVAEHQQGEPGARSPVMLRSNVVVEGIGGQQQRSDEKDRFGEVRLVRICRQDNAMAVVLDGNRVPYSRERFVDEAGAAAA
jgi:hypothetical protein